MADHNHDIERYLKGEMTRAERHALEKKALSDPFLSDALEGAQQLSANEFMRDVAAINQRISEPQKNRNRWLWLYAAASLLLVVVASYMLLNEANEMQPAPLALKNEKHKDAVQNEPNTRDSTTDAGTKDHKQREQPTADNTQPVLAEKPKELSTDGKLGEAVPMTEAKADEQAEAESVAELAQELPPAKAAPTSSSVVSDDGVKKESTAEPERKKVARSPQVARSAQQTIAGQVTSAEDGSPLPGINVVIKGSTIGTVTDEQGRYVLSDVDLKSTLVYSFIGLQTQEISAGERTELDVTMNLDVTQLSEVVVTGYGSRDNDNTTPTIDFAHPEDGYRAYRKYLEENVRYPQQALEAKTEGRVTVEFFVETDGRLTNFEVVRGIGSGCDEELIRLVKEGPRWIPTKKDNLPVREKARVRLKFELPK